MILNRKISNMKTAYPIVFLLFFSLFLSGCGGMGQAVYKIDPDRMAEYAGQKMLDDTATLKLNQQLCNQKYFVGNGLTYYADIGEAFCVNAKWMMANLFKKWVVTGEKKPTDTDLVITPQIIFIHKTTRLYDPQTPQPRDVWGKYAWQKLSIGLFVKWTITDDKGNIKWVDIVQGLGKGRMGGPFTYKSNSKEQIRMALEDMFRNTHALLTLSLNRSGGETITQAYPYEYLNWTIAKNRDSVNSYDYFLNHFPDGLFSRQAQKAKQDAVLRGPDATTRFCDCWSKVKIGMAKKTVWQIMTTQKLAGDIKDVKIRIYPKKGAKEKKTELYETDLWTARFDNDILVGTKREVTCDEWRAYFYSFLKWYLK